MTYILKQFKLYRYRCFELVMVIRILLAMVVIKILLVMVLNILFMVVRLTIVVKDFKLIA